ncbi:MAG: radical SAM/SPASM domain-containing protein [Nitrospirae bacterium]|nr:radical SAM/SPASM domain-containing protein [Nitrospirota bacterium]
MDSWISRAFYRLFTLPVDKVKIGHIFSLGRLKELYRIFWLNDDAKIVDQIVQMSPEEIQHLLRYDPWLKNLMMNYWEFAVGRTTLTTYPWDICIPICDACNARCTFCTSWLEGKEQISLEQLDRFESILRFGRRIGLAGHGEPLSHPLIIEILDRIKGWIDPRAACYVITNGVYLESLMDRLIAARVTSYAISLNAASAETHQAVMGLKAGSFEKIVESIHGLVSMRDSGGENWVSISMVVTQQNFHEVEKFVELGNRLRVNNIQIKTLAGVGGEIPGLNYHELPPYLHPDFQALKQRAVDAINKSSVSVQSDTVSWEIPVFSGEMEEKIRFAPLISISREEAIRSKEVRQYWRGQEKFIEKTKGALLNPVDDFDGNNPFGRIPRYSCRSPYHTLYINDFSYSMVPCCYLNAVPGYEKNFYDGSGDFLEAWNSPGMVELRRRLKEGPLFNMCTKCPSTF